MRQRRDFLRCDGRNLSTIFVLALIISAAQAQTFKIIHNFTGGRDGANSCTGLTMDRAVTSMA